MDFEQPRITPEIVVGIAGAAVLVAAAVYELPVISALAHASNRAQRRAGEDATVPKDNAAASSSSSVSAISAASSRKAKKGLDKVKAKVAATTNAALHTTEGVRTMDKVVFTLSVVNVVLSAYLLGFAPGWIHYIQTPKMVLYMAHRFVTFKQKHDHYLMMDFCYWANLLSLVYFWMFPHNETLFQILFLVGNGPLAWAVLTFKGSMIFHSAPHMTSVFIHTSPMMLTYALRWYPSAFNVCSDWPTCAEEPETGIWAMVSETHLTFYLPWVLLYYLWIFVLMNDRIKKRGYKTLFDRVSNRGPTKFLTRVSRNEYVCKACYMLVHVAFATVTMLLATAYWRSQAAHFLFVAAILATSAWNAAGFYFTVFANRYTTELEERLGK